MSTRALGDLAETLLAAALQGSGWRDLLQLASDATGRATRLVAVHGGLFAASDGLGRMTFASRAPAAGVAASASTDGGLAPDDVATVFESGGDLPVCIRCTDGLRSAAMPIAVGRRRVGIVLIEGAVDDVAVEVLGALRLPVAIEASRRDAEAAVRAENGARLVDALRQPGHPHLSALDAIIHHWGLDLHAPLAAAVFEAPGTDAAAWSIAVRWIETPVAVHVDRAWTVLAGDVEDELRRIWTRLTGILGTRVLAAAGPRVTGADVVHRSFAQADLLIEHIRDSDGEAPMTYDTMGVAALLLDVTPSDRDRFVRRTLGSLLGRPELLQTLRAWCASGGSREDTAMALGVHRNTVGYRLALIAELLGLEAMDPRRSVDVLTALRVLEVFGASPGLKATSP